MPSQKKDPLKSKSVTLEFTGKATVQMTDAQLKKLLDRIENESSVDIGDIEGVDQAEAISTAVIDVEDAY